MSDRKAIEAAVTAVNKQRTMLWSPEDVARHTDAIIVEVSGVADGESLVDIVERYLANAVRARNNYFTFGVGIKEYKDAMGANHPWISERAKFMAGIKER